MDEPDGLHGLVRLRQGGLVVQDKIAVAQKSGQWDEALSLYAQAITQQDDGHLVQDLVILMSQTGDTKQIGVQRACSSVTGRNTAGSSHFRDDQSIMQSFYVEILLPEVGLVLLLCTPGVPFNCTSVFSVLSWTGFCFQGHVHNQNHNSGFASAGCDVCFRLGNCWMS